MLRSTNGKNTKKTYREFVHDGYPFRSGVHWEVLPGILNELPLKFIELPPLRSAPSAAAERPEDARTESSAASSMSFRMEVTFRKTPGSMGGGTAFPG